MNALLITPQSINEIVLSDFKEVEALIGREIDSVVSNQYILYHNPQAPNINPIATQLCKPKIRPDRLIKGNAVLINTKRCPLPKLLISQIKHYEYFAEPCTRDYGPR